MKNMKKTLFIALILVLALAVVTACDHQSVALASNSSSVESFLFDFKDGKFVLSHNGNVLYQKAYYSDTELVEVIEQVVGVDGDYDLVIPSPQITVAVSNGGDVQPYSKTDNKFSFVASSTHVFDGLAVDGFSKVDITSGFTWTYSRNDGAETDMAGHGQAIDFGKGNAYGKYAIFAYGSVSFQFDGRVFYAEGKSAGVEVEIQKASADDVVINEDVTKVITREYGQSVGEIVESVNIPGNLDYMVEFAEDQNTEITKDTILDVKTEAHGLPVYYISGNWDNGQFVADENVDKVLVILGVNVVPYEVRILINHTKFNVGDNVDISNCWEWLSSSKLPCGHTSKDLGIAFHVETEDGQAVDAKNIGAGKYYVRGSFSNTNYNVIFLDYENKDKTDYSRRATLIIRPVVLTTSDDNFTYSLLSSKGFEYGETLVLADSANGGKTLLVKNGETDVEYDNLTLVIERKDATTQAVLLFVDGQWKEYTFDANGKVQVGYSTLKANVEKFGVKAVAPIAPEEDKTSVIIGAVIAMLAGLFCCIGTPLISKYGKKKEEEKMDICDDDSVDPLRQPEQKAEPTTEENKEEQKEQVEHHQEETKPLTLEEKYALHPEFVPTPSVEDAFKGEETEDIQDDEKDVDESAEEGKITFKSKMLGASVENKAIYNALKNNLLSYKGIKSRVVNGGDYFRRPGKQIVKIIFIGKTIRLALALNPDDYDYNVYHQKNRATMKKYFDTPMFVKVQSLLGVRRALKLIADLMEKEGVKPSKQPQYDDYLYNLTYENDNE